MNCENLIQFLSSSPTAWHAVDTVKNTLTENGYTELKESEKWQIEPCGKYFVRRNDSSLIAFEIPEEKSYTGPDCGQVFFYLGDEPKKFLEELMPMVSLLHPKNAGVFLCRMLVVWTLILKRKSGSLGLI